MVVLELSVYIAIFAVASLGMALYQKVYNQVYVTYAGEGRHRPKAFVFCMIGCIVLFPIIAMYGLRYGIGTDYFGYQGIYETLHKAGIAEYWEGYRSNADTFYVEPAYYVLNKLLPNYRLLIWGIGILLFLLFLLAVKDYSTRISFGLALFIYLSTQFIYAMNGVRFAIALLVVLLAYIQLVKGKTLGFIMLVLFASLFHRSSLFCLAMVFLKKFKYRGTNDLRDIALFSLILLFPLISGFLLKLAGKISVFERYFSTSSYSANETMSGGWTWLLHVIPPLLPVILIAHREIFDSADTKVLFRISIMEVPFRMLGLYNTWYTRFTRFSQIAQVIFIPLVLKKVTNKSTRAFLYAYYILWFAAYFAYYAIVNDAGDSLPYVWVLSR